MKKYITIYIFILLTIKALAAPEGDYGKVPLFFRKIESPSTEKADSIMKLVISSAIRYENLLSSYETEIYIKGRAEILKSNALIRFGNLLFPVNRRNKDMVFEIVSHSRFDAPNTYFHEFEAINGSSIPNSKKQQEVLNFLNLNVYSSTAYNDGILMPVAKNAFTHYNFNLESTEEVDGFKIYKIRFLPKQWSQKLVSGDLYIMDKWWTIDKIDLNGRYSFAEFNLVMNFSRDYQKFILPETADLFLRYKALGNTVVSTYHTNFNFKSVEWRETERPKRRHEKLDLSRYYRLSSDTVPIIQDSAYWVTKRDIPLTAEEAQLYTIKKEETNAMADTSEAMKYLRFTEKLTNTVHMDFNTTRIRYSGLLNPFQLGYSGRNGVTYRQRFRISKTFADDRQLRFRPEAGYVFKRKEFFFKLGADWEYLPERRGALSLTAGNDNNNYSSEIMNDINEMLQDSTFTFDDLNLKYFRHYFIEVRNNIEITNGFEVSAALSYHRRLAVKDKNNKNVNDDDIVDRINDRYNDFISTIGFSYTPRQYYRMDGRRKEYVYSYFPTFTIEFGKSIPKVFGSTGNYERIEADLHQSINIGLLRRINYRISGGLYTRQKSTYFADFRYFRRRYFPETWNDHIGGVFNTLKSEWYNASDKYVQGHFMYQSPFIISKLFKRRTSKHILSERFYYSHLWTPVLPSYSEIGYGLGNHIFNIAIFAGFEKHEYQSLGFKFAFELFQ